MSDETNNSNGPRTHEASLSRRRMLKAAVATAPVIATLPSGAALARSSNLISATTGSGTDIYGRTLCLNLNSGTYVDGMLDLGPAGDGSVTRIPERVYREGIGGATEITERAMCERGGDFYYQQYGWNKVTVPRGIVVSATALSSFVGSITFNDV